MNFPKKQISNFFTEKRASKSYSPPGSIDLPVNLGTKKKAEISLFSFDENSRRTKTNAETQAERIP